MAGKAGRSGRHYALKSMQRIAQEGIESHAPEIIEAYIQKGIQGDSAILINLADRIAGKVKSIDELKITGGLDFNVNALFIAYRDAQQALLDKVEVKQLASPESQNNEGEPSNVI